MQLPIEVNHGGFFTLQSLKYLLTTKVFESRENFYAAAVYKTWDGAYWH